jgi:tetratricopeptide (TPR) repeat protein
MGPCPDDQQLQRLLDGVVRPNDAVAIDRHISICDRCLARLDELTSRQTLAVNADSPSDVEPDVQRAIQSLKNMVPIGLPGGDTANEPHETHDGDSSSLDYSLLLDSLSGYDVFEEIGVGSTGRVYRALDRRLHRMVALKVLHASLIQDSVAQARLEREAISTAALSHDHIVTLFDLDTDHANTPFLVMEYVDGQSLEQQIRKEGPGDPHHAARGVASIADALQCAHDSGVIHRDVKSSNILIEAKTGQIKITDFGLARTTESTTQLTYEGMIAGTPAYMSPEQIAAPSSVGTPSDVYSLGVVLYQWLTGMLPFRGTTRMVLSQVQHEDPTPPRQLNDAIPIDIDTICLKCLTKEPEQRYGSAAELADDLRRFLEYRPVLARRLGWVGCLKRWARRNPRVTSLWLAVATTFLLALGISLASAIQLGIAYKKVKLAEQDAWGQANVAAKQRDASLETLRKLVVDVPQALRYVPEDTTEVEELVSRIALQGLEEISAASGSSQVSLSSGMGHFQLGATLWRVGELDDARRHLESARKVVDRLKSDLDAKERPDDELTELEVDVALHLGFIALEAERFETSGQEIDTAVTLARQWMARGDGDIQPRIRLAECLTVRAELSFESGNVSAAKESIADAQTLLDVLVEDQPENDEVLFNLDVLQAVIEDMEFANSRGHRADNNLEQWSAEEIRSWDKDERQQHVKEESDRAQQAVEDVDRDEALDAFSNLLAIAEANPTHEPVSSEVQLEARLHLGRLYVDFGVPRDANRIFKELIEQLSRLPEEDRELPKARQLERAARLGMGLALLDMNRDTRAVAILNELASELQQVEPPTIGSRMLQIEIRFGLSYLSDLEETELMQLEQSVREEMKSINALPESSRPVDYALWFDRVSEELDYLREDARAE